MWGARCLAPDFGPHPANPESVAKTTPSRPFAGPLHSLHQVASSRHRGSWPREARHCRRGRKTSQSARASSARIMGCRVSSVRLSAVDCKCFRPTNLAIRTANEKLRRRWQRCKWPGCSCEAALCEATPSGPITANLPAQSLCLLAPISGWVDVA